MPLLNYTTQVPASKTVSEIHTILAKHGATAILTEYGPNHEVIAISFKVLTKHGELPFQLPCKPEAVYKILRKRPRARYRVLAEQHDKEQAERVAWRILKDWVEAQIAIIETEMVTVEQVFLPYAVTPTGQTLYEALAERQFKALAGPSEIEGRR